MRENRIIGAAYRKPMLIGGGIRKSPCICSAIAKYYSQYQLYPMIIEIYEKGNGGD